MKRIQDNASVNCQVCRLREGESLCSYVEARSENLEHKRILHDYPPRQILFYEGDPPYYVYQIHTGFVKLYKENRDQAPKVIRLLGPGAMFGYRAVVADEPFAATAEAVTQATICAIPRDVFMNELHHNNQLSIALIHLLASELRESEEMWVHQSQERAVERLARFLLEASKMGTMTLTVSAKKGALLHRSEIAQLIGVAPETLSRILRDLSARGILLTDRSTIRIVNLSKLRTLISDPALRT